MGETMLQERVHPVIQKASTVNYHLLQACNMSCGFCFATFLDIPSSRLRPEESLELVTSLCLAGFRKINFAGGEPTLLPNLPDLIRQAKSHGLVTSLVTNGSRIDEEFLDELADCIDSVDSHTLHRIGRVERGKAKSPIDAARYLALAEMIRERRIFLKVNTVVNRANHAEDFRSFILAMQPQRWKIFQVLPVDGQNDARIDQFTITDEQFARYVKRNRSVEQRGITVIPESNDMITGSYIMVDPLGRFYDDTKGRHTYSRPILEVGVANSLEDVVVYADRFEQRGGNYQAVL